MKWDSEKTITRHSLTERIYSQLIEMITSLELVPASRINFNDLCRLFAVSRAPLREAVQRLVAGGLIISKPQLGYYTINLTDEDVIDLYEIRIFIETMALKRAIYKIPKEELKKIQKIFEKELIRTKDTENPEASDKYKQADWRLHFSLIIGYSDSKILKQTSQGIFHLLEMTRNYIKNLGHSASRHIEIINAILEKDVDKSCTLLTRHLEDVKRKVIEALKA